MIHRITAAGLPVESLGGDSPLISLRLGPNSTWTSGVRKGRACQALEQCEPRPGQRNDWCFQGKLTLNPLGLDWEVCVRGQVITAPSHEALTSDTIG